MNNHIGIRASSAGKICTNRPFFDKVKLVKTRESLEQKIIDKKLEVSLTEVMRDAEEFKKVRGFKMVIDAYEKAVQDKANAEIDPLPKGAITYAQELWLENNRSLYDLTLRSDNPVIMKGNTMEDEAIKFIGKFKEIPQLQKNEERFYKDFISGEPDMLYEIVDGKVVRDSKVPTNWKSFRNKTGLESMYYWQLIAYCYLTGAKFAYLDYVLLPTHGDMVEAEVRGLSAEEYERWVATQESIKNSEPYEKIKSYEIPPSKIQEDINFFVGRLEKFKAYYNTLTYEICMNF